MKLLLAIIFMISSAQAQDIFKDLRTYYNACGLIGRDDPRFDGCNPPHMAQIMENFKKDPKNVEDMKKIARFHMTHSLQTPAKNSLRVLAKNLNLKEAMEGNDSFVISLCGQKNSLELGQKIKDPHALKMKMIQETLEKVKRDYPCSIGQFRAFAVGVVDVTGNPDAWMMNEKKEIKQIIRSTPKTPFSTE